MYWLVILSLLTVSSAFADSLPSDLRPYERDLPIVKIQANRDLDLEYLQDSEDIEVAALGFPSFIEISSEKWRRACESPCNERQYRRNIYRISGDGVVTSSVFTLPRRGRHITLNVTPGSVTVRKAGWATLSFGLVFFTGGTIAMALSSLYGPTDGKNPVLLAGAVPTAIGVSLLITTIPLLVKSRTVLTAEAQ